MLQQQHPEGPPRDQRRILIIAGESPLRSLISLFLSTMRCPYAIASTPQQLAGVRHKTFDWALIDLGNSGMPVEQAIVSLRELQPGLSERILAFSSGATKPEMLELIERYGLRQMPRQTSRPQVSATLLELTAASRITGPAPRSMQVAQLIFDSFRSPLPAGVRSSHESSRLLAYRHKNKIVDLLITPEVASSRVTLDGQVTGGGMGMGMGKNNGLAVLLIDGMRTVARTATSQFGEFQLEFEILENPSLQIRLHEGSWAVIPLGKMDWVKKPLLN
jgi:hypothetical protein